MKTPQKNARRKSAAVSKSRKVTPRRPKIKDQKGRYARTDKTHISLPHMEEAELSGDELETVRTGVAWKVVGVFEQARKSHGGGCRVEMEQEKENWSGSAVKRKFPETTKDVCRNIGSGGGEDGKGVSTFTPSRKVKKVKTQKEFESVSVTAIGPLPLVEATVNELLPLELPQFAVSQHQHIREPIPENVTPNGGDIVAASNDINGHSLVTEEHEDPIIGQVLHSRYWITRVLGRGNFSTTYLAEYLPPDEESPEKSDISYENRRPNTLVAVKRVNESWLAPMGQTEYDTLHSLFLHDSPRHIIQPLSAFFDDGNVFHLVLEPLDSARPVSLPEACACQSSHTRGKCTSILACPGRIYLFQKLMVQLLSGLQVLHKHGFIHADLTPSNVLYLPESNRIKIIDLGNVIGVDEPPAEGDSEFEVQSAHYRAPEILLGAGPVGQKMDVWGAGVLGLEWLLGNEGREELEREISLVEDVKKVEDIESSGTWQPVMAVPIPTRTALVTRTALLFGKLDSYRHGIFWKEEYLGLGKIPVGVDPTDEFGLGSSDESNGILSRFLINSTLSPGLAEFMGKMLDVDVWQRKTCVEVLRDGWLMRGLLGEWASVLLDNEAPQDPAPMHTEHVIVVQEDNVTNKESEWVEGMDDSGFAESMDEEIEEVGENIAAPLPDDREWLSEELHLRNSPPCSNLSPSQEEYPPDISTTNNTTTTTTTTHPPPTSRQATPDPPLRLVNPQPQPLLSTPPPRRKVIKNFDSPYDDTLSFISPTDFPFTYTRFCASPSPPLPHLFQSPSPEPLPPPSPGQSAYKRGEEDAMGNELRAEREVLLQIMSETAPADVTQPPHHHHDHHTKEANQQSRSTTRDTPREITFPPAGDISQLKPGQHDKASSTSSGGLVEDSPKEREQKKENAEGNNHSTSNVINLHYDDDDDEASYIWHMDLKLAKKDSDEEYEDEDDDEIRLL